jgi:hypothetical protein
LALMTPIVLAFNDKRALVVALADGSIRELAIADGRETVLGDVPSAIALTANGASVLALGRDRLIWRVGAVPVLGCGGLDVTDLNRAWAIGERIDGTFGRCDLATERLTTVATTPYTSPDLAVTRFGAALVRDRASGLQLLGDPGLIPALATEVEELTAGRFLVRTPDGLSIVSRGVAPRALPESAGVRMFTRLGSTVAAHANRRLLVWDLESGDAPAWYGDYDLLSGLAITPRYIIARAATHFVLIPRTAPDPATIRAWASRVR